MVAYNQPIDLINPPAQTPWWQQPQFTSFAGNALQDLGYGLTQGKNISQGLAAASQRTAQMQPQRTAYQAELEKEQARLDQINQTREWVYQNAPDEYISAMESNVASPADIWTQMNQPTERKTARDVNGTLRYLDTGEQAFAGVEAQPDAPLVNIEGDPVPQIGTITPGWEVITDELGARTMRPIAGGPAALEIEADANKADVEDRAAAARANVQTVTDAEKAQTMLSATADIREIMTNSGGQPVTGTGSIPLGLISGTPAGRVRSYITTLKSGIALSAMARLKEASATGATGFGALNTAELNILIADIGALDPNTTEPDIFLDTVGRIENRYKRVLADIEANVSPERIQELGLTELIASAKQGNDPIGVPELIPGQSIDLGGGVTITRNN